MFHQDLDELRDEKENEDIRKICENEVTDQVNALRLATLTRMKDRLAINACGKITDDVKHGWTRMSLAVDSGAC